MSEKCNVYTEIEFTKEFVNMYQQSHNKQEFKHSCNAYGELLVEKQAIETHQ